MSPILTIHRSKKSESTQLGNIQREAFNGQEEHFATESDDSIKSKMNHSEKVHNFSFYLNDIMIGGTRIFEYKNHVFYLEKIFIDPKHQGKGFGEMAMMLIEKSFPEAKNWTLSSQKRNKKFYKKLGYKVVNKHRNGKNTYYIFYKNL